MTTAQPSPKSFKDNWLNKVTTLLFVLGILCVGYVLFSYFIKKSQLTKIGNLDCVKTADMRPVEDEFMTGLFEKGSLVKVLENFYNCNTPKVGDIVWYRFSEQIPPVVRFIRGAPGDRYELKPAADKKGLWTIAINGNEVKAGSEPYYIQSNSVPPLKTYELSRNGVLLDDEFILLANKSPSISDSSNLGLVQKKHLAGKVTTEK